jgi:hypothetical protein
MMTQSIFGGGMGGRGIVPVLVIIGIFLIGSGANAIAGQLAIWGGVLIGICLGVLGVFGVVSRYI